MLTVHYTREGLAYRQTTMHMARGGNSGGIGKNKVRIATGIN